MLRCHIIIFLVGLPIWNTIMIIKSFKCVQFKARHKILPICSKIVFYVEREREREREELHYTFSSFYQYISKIILGCTTKPKRISKEIQVETVGYTHMRLVPFMDINSNSSLQIMSHPLFHFGKVRTKIKVKR